MLTTLIDIGKIILLSLGLYVITRFVSINEEVTE